MTKKNERPPDDLTDEEREVKDARLKESIERKNELLQLRALMEDPKMRAFLWRVISRCKIYGEAMQSNFGLVGYALGQQSIGKWLITEINEAEPRAWFAMQMEHLAPEEDAATPPSED